MLEWVAAALLVRHLDLLPVALQEVDRLHELVVLPLPLTAGGPVALGTDGLARVGGRVKGLGWGLGSGSRLGSGSGSSVPMALAMSSSCNARWLSAIFCLAYLGSRLGIGLGVGLGLG